MKFEEVLPALRAGKRVRGHPDGMWLDAKGSFGVSVADLTHDRWEIEPDPKPSIPKPTTFCGYGVELDASLTPGTIEIRDRRGKVLVQIRDLTDELEKKP